MRKKGRCLSQVSNACLPGAPTDDVGQGGPKHEECGWQGCHRYRASGGIGRAIAERLAQDGISVVVNYGTSAAEAASVVDGITSHGSRAIAIQADMGSGPEVRRLVHETQSHFGRLDVLVNNAAIAPSRPAVEVTEEELDRAFAVNARGPLLAMQEAARVLPEGGRIINISSSATTVGFPGLIAYPRRQGSARAIPSSSRTSSVRVDRR